MSCFWSVGKVPWCHSMGWVIFGTRCFRSSQHWLWVWWSVISQVSSKHLGLMKERSLSSIVGFRKPEDADPKLMIPVFDILFPFLPEKIRSKLRFGVRYRRDSDQVTYIYGSRICIVDLLTRLDKWSHRWTEASVRNYVFVIDSSAEASHTYHRPGSSQSSLSTKWTGRSATVRIRVDQTNETLDVQSLFLSV